MTIAFFRLRWITPQQIVDWLFCASCIASFYASIYPALFLITSLAACWVLRRFLWTSWMGWLCVYVVYALATYARNPSLAEGSTLNAMKLVVNFTFFASWVSWLLLCPSVHHYRLMRKTVVAIVVISAAQLVLYHAATGFAYLRPAASSDVGEAVYQPSYSLWGPADKNIFGAKLAVFGFLFVFSRWFERGTVPYLRMAFVLAIAYCSMSRTPMLALALGFLAITLSQPRKYFLKVCLLAAVAAALPAILQSIVRLDVLTQANDGFGIRLIYWATFLQHLDAVSLWGNGFLAARSFLEAYAPFYNGEPQLHNLLFNNYLDFGIVGLSAFLLFFVLYIRQGWRLCHDRAYWIIGLTPLVGIMLTLYTGYESDFVIYLGCLYLFTSTARVPSALPKTLHTMHESLR